jgi:RNA polymerase sigma-70 factor (ECF subfamily)
MKNFKNKQQNNNSFAKTDSTDLISDIVNYEDLSDIELVEKSLLSDAKAFEIIVKRYFSMIYKFVWLYLKDQDDSTDITQETFIRVWKNLHKFDTKKSFKTWLFAIAKNASLDLIKKKKSLNFSVISEDDDELSSFFHNFVEDSDSLDKNIDREIIKSGLYKVMEKISPIYKTVIFLRYVNNLKFIEIAKELNESIDTIKSRHRRGLFALKKVISNENLF